MTKTSPNSTVELRNFHDLSDILCAVYRHSDYRFGILFLSEAMADGKYPAHLVAPPKHMKSGWTRTHEIPVIMHPEQGVLLLRRAELRDGEPPEAIGAHIEQSHKEITNLEWKLRHRLAQQDFWRHRSIVMGVAIVTRHDCPDEYRPLSVDADVIIDGNDLARFPSHIDAIFDYYTTDAATPVDDWAPRLIDTIADPAEELSLGFMVQADLIRSYEDCDCALDGLIETAD